MKLGDRVSDRHGNIGVIRRVYDDFSAVAASCRTMTGEEWLAAQEIPFSAEHLEETWFSVEFPNGGGSVWSPQSQLALEYET